MAIAAAICLPLIIPPAASTGTFESATAWQTSGTSTMVDTSPQWPPASVPETINTSTPASTCFTACSLAPTKAPTTTPLSLPISSIYWGGTPKALTISLIGCENATSIMFAALPFVRNPPADPVCLS